MTIKMYILEDEANGKALSMTVRRTKKANFTYVTRGKIHIQSIAQDSAIVASIGHVSDACLYRMIDLTEIAQNNLM
jgi:hypothetical protein